MRFAVLKRDGFACRYCHRYPPSVELQVDHVFPVSRGGQNTMDNLVTACFDCNIGKSDSRVNFDPGDELPIVRFSLSDIEIKISGSQGWMQCHIEDEGDDLHLMPYMLLLEDSFVLRAYIRQIQIKEALREGKYNLPIFKEAVDLCDVAKDLCFWGLIERRVPAFLSVDGCYDDLLDLLKRIPTALGITQMPWVGDLA